ncbi:MAG: hypothetical protein ACM3SS_20735 [Rhodospirillaceae bacterium]
MKQAALVLMWATTIAAPAYARLPPPSPEQQAAAAEKKAEEARQAREQQDALTRVQDRIAAKFGRGATSAGPTSQDNLSKKTVEPAGTTGPIGGKAQSAEAHSTPAR